MKRKASGHRYEVSIITAAVGFTATAAAVATVGAGVMAAGSVLGIKEAKQVGGLMMAGGGIASGLGGLGMVGGVAGATSTLGTLSAGAQLVGGALQGVGVLTGNDRISNIGALINVGGTIGSSFDSGMFSDSGKTIDGKVFDPQYGINGDAGAIGSATKKANEAVKVGGDAMGGFMDKIKKYDNIIGMVGKGADMMNTNRQLNDVMSFNANQRELDRQAQKSMNTAAPIGGPLPIGVKNPGPVKPIVPGQKIGLLSTTYQPGVK
jgi:hypothetical protein